MTTQKPVVNCSVANCSYWGSGNKCHAQSIIIDVDANSRARYDAEFAGDRFEAKAPESALNSSVTCCHTFKPKAGASE